MLDGVAEGEVMRQIQRQLELAATPKGQGQITENERKLIRDMRSQGIACKWLARWFKVSVAAIEYHSNDRIRAQRQARQRAA